MPINAAAGKKRGKIGGKIIAIHHRQRQMRVRLAERLQTAGKTFGAVIAGNGALAGGKPARQSDENRMPRLTQLNMLQNCIELLCQAADCLNPRQISRIVQLAAGKHLRYRQMPLTGEHPKQQSQLTATTIKTRRLINLANNLQLPGRRWCQQQRWHPLLRAKKMHQAQIRLLRLDAGGVITIILKRQQTGILPLRGRAQAAATAPRSDPHLKKSRRPVFLNQGCVNIHPGQSHSASYVRITKRNDCQRRPSAVCSGKTKRAKPLSLKCARKKNCPS
jgi:hypothetical protein